jgi:hypothetical protein
MGKREKLEEIYSIEDGLVFADGFDGAIIGVSHESMRVVYSFSKGVDIIMNINDYDYDEAVEWMFYNVLAHGESLPIWVHDDFYKDDI